jgi:hypothetical protein
VNLLLKIHFNINNFGQLAVQGQIKDVAPRRRPQAHAVATP